MDDVWLDFTERIVIVLIGVLLATSSTTIVTMALENGAFAAMSKRRILGIRLFGGVAALIAGLQILSSSKTSTPFDLVYSLWLAQVVAGVGGGEGWRQLGRFLKPESKMPTTKEDS